MKHRHHIIPRHMGGTDSPDNLTPPISILMHAAFHKDLYENLGHTEDLIAWKALSGRITSEEARLEAALVGQSRSVKYKESRKICGEHLRRVATQESCRKGGLAASKGLVSWIEENIEAHSKQCTTNGRLASESNKIPHKYRDVMYSSKKELQSEFGISNCGFYGKLKRGEITRLPSDE